MKPKTRTQPTQPTATPTSGESGLRKQSVIAELTKSPHGDLKAYLETGGRVSAEDPEFLAHLIAWNHANGKIRDSKAALPILSLLHAFRNPLPHSSLYAANAQAHLAKLDPRTLLRALSFGRSLKIKVAAVRPVVERYIKEREKRQNWWDRTVLQHRASMKSLYWIYGIGQSQRAKAVLWGTDKLASGERVKLPLPRSSAFAILPRLKDMEPVAAAAAVVKHRIPYLIAAGALGAKLKDTTVLMTLIERMSPAELVTNMKGLEELGVRKVPALRAALESALKKAATSRKASTPTLKTGVAAAAVTDEKLKAQLNAVQEKQITAAGIDGDWLVLGDMSGSMEGAIELAKMVAATLTRAVKGRVMLIFFNTSPRRFDVTGKTYEEIKAMTATVHAGGGTSIGCGLDMALSEGFTPDGIAVVSDGGENESPIFADVYHRLTIAHGHKPPVYLYHCGGLHDNFGAYMWRLGHTIETFPISAKTDYYSLPNLISTMRVNKYSLVQEILDTPLITMDDVFSSRVEEAEEEAETETV